MAQIKISEGELRNIVRNIISESSKKTINEMPSMSYTDNSRGSEYELETPEGVKFFVNAHVDSLGDGTYEIGDDDYDLVEGSYNPEDLDAIIYYMENYKSSVEQEIVNQASRGEWTPEDMNESVNLLKEENINDFFQMLEKDPRKKSFAYIYYTAPVQVNKFMMDENGVKVSNPMVGKLFKNKQIKFNYAETFREVMAKRNPDYVLGSKSGKYEKLGGYDVIESGKNGLYMPVLPKQSKTTYSILEDGQWAPIEKSEIQKYLRPEQAYMDNGKPIVNQLIVDRIARISAGGNIWTNPNFIYKYLGPKNETFE